MKKSDFYVYLATHVFEQKSINEEAWVFPQVMMDRMLDEYTRGDKSSKRFFPIAKEHVGEYYIKLAIIETINYLSEKELICLEDDVDLIKCIIHEFQMNNMEML